MDPSSPRYPQSPLATQALAPAAPPPAAEPAAAAPALAAPPPALPPPAPAAPALASAASPSFPSPPSPTSLGSLGAGLALALLAVAAFLLARRRRRSPRLVEIVESASLGPKRSLVVARLGDELLVLGASEGGISLLATRPAPPSASRSPAADRPSLGTGSAALAPPGAQGLLAGLGRRLRPGKRFEDELGVASLGERSEDEELRRKLAAGQTGSVR